MGNSHSVCSIEFVNKSDIAKVQVAQADGKKSKSLAPKGTAKFEIIAPTEFVIKGIDKNGRVVHELKTTIPDVASTQVWKITNSGIKRKRSPFFTETYPWTKSHKYPVS